MLLWDGGGFPHTVFPSAKSSGLVLRKILGVFFRINWCSLAGLNNTLACSMVNRLFWGGWLGMYDLGENGGLKSTQILKRKRMS